MGVDFFFFGGGGVLFSLSDDGGVGVYYLFILGIISITMMFLIRLIEWNSYT